MKKIKFIKPDLILHESVAIVGSSNNVLNRYNGGVIDRFKEVVRFNRAPVKGYEQDVGSRTTLRVVNPHVFTCEKFTRWKTDNNFVQRIRNGRIVCMGHHSKGHFKRQEKIDKSNQLFHCEHFGSIKIPEIKNGTPTIGIAFIWLCIQADIVPHVFGFGVYENGISHYFEERDNKSNCHNYNPERDALKRWYQEGKIKLCL